MTLTPEAPPTRDPEELGAPPAKPEPRPRGPRDPLLDNAKYVAIVLVAVGHGIVGLWSNPIAGGSYTFFYLFHMPVFVMISGYLSRSFTMTDSRVGKLVATTLAPYLIFQALYAMFAWSVDGRAFQFDLLDPYYLTWFLLALFLWRLLTPVIRRMRYPVATAVVICLLAYMANLGNTLDIYRVLGLFPFYVLGMSLTADHIAMLRRPAVRITGAVLLAGACAGAFVVYDRMNTSWLRWDTPNAAMGVDEITGTVMRVALLGVGTVLSLAFLAVLPNRRTWYTDLGVYTLFGYLLHGFFTRLITFMDWHKIEFLSTTPGVLLVGGLCAVLVTVLCTPPVRAATKWLVEPPIDRLLARS